VRLRHHIAASRAQPDETAAYTPAKRLPDRIYEDPDSSWFIPRAEMDRIAAERKVH
jgi:hypothetical protein